MKTKILLFFIPLLFCFFQVAMTAHAQPSLTTSASLASNKSPITITSPQQDLPISGSFFIRGIANNSEGVKKIVISLTSLYDKSQKPINTYKAAYDQKTQVWSAKVNAQELDAGMYIIQVAVTDSKETNYTFSSFIIAPENSSANTI